jgi:hypothetical protein
MLWGVLSLAYATLRADDHARTSAAGQSAGARSDAARRALPWLLLFGAVGTALYFTGGFTFFFVQYFGSVVALCALALRRICYSERSFATARRWCVISLATYCGGFLLLWLPGEVLCAHGTDRLPMHALFHLTSAAGPHLALTAMALHAHQREKPRARPSALFCGLPAIERPARALLAKAV